MIIKELKAENWENCDVHLIEMDNRIWVASGTCDNYAVSYTDAKQLYEELKDFFEKKTNS